VVRAARERAHEDEVIVLMRGDVKTGYGREYGTKLCKCEWELVCLLRVLDGSAPPLGIEVHDFASLHHPVNPL
jgi:hypothetical protein